MDIRTFSDQCDLQLLADNSSSNYAQVWTKVLSDCERVVYLAIGHASVNVTFNVQRAEDGAGTGAESMKTNVTLVANKVSTIEIGPGDLTPQKQFVSPLATRSAGTYSLIQMKFSLRHPGEFTHDTTWAHQVDAGL